MSARHHVLACLALFLTPCLAQNPVHHGTFAITNVRVFDGWTLLPQSSATTVTVTDGLIASISADEPLSSVARVDGAGGLLTPGFIDAHVHVDYPATDLTWMRSQGITTAFDCACLSSKAECDAKNLAIYPPSAPAQSDGGGTAAATADHAAYAANISAFAPFPQMFQAYLPAIAPVGTHAHMVPASQHVRTVDEGLAFVAARLAERADHIKLVVTTPGHPLELVSAMAGAARAAGVLTVCHAADVGAFMRAIKAGCDQLHHVPLDGVLTAAQVEAVRASGRPVAPTLIQMKGIADALNAIPVIWLKDIWDAARALLSGGSGLIWRRRYYANGRENVRLLAAAGVPIMVSTDATGVEAPVALTVSMADGFQREIGLLAEAGLDARAILTGATALPARFFRRDDRGRIAVGARADLVLTAGNALDRVEDMLRVRRVWIGGVVAAAPHGERDGQEAAASELKEPKDEL